MFGFTKQEQGVILFLLITLLIGGSHRVYRDVFRKSEHPPVDSAFTEAFRSRTTESNGTLGKLRSDSGSAVARMVADTLLGQPEHFRIKLNTATRLDLQNIPQIGPVLAQRIIDYRNHAGGFRKLEELRSIKGIGDAKFRKICPYLTLQ